MSSPRPFYQLKRSWLLLAAGAVLAGGGWYAGRQSAAPAPTYVSYRVDLRRQQLQLYWRDEHGKPLRSLGQLKSWLAGRGEQLVFAMNAGMYKAGNTPLGLFVQEQQLRTPLDTGSGPGNFYLKPNGVFYTTTDHRAGVCSTADFAKARNVRFATQSGPMLVIDGHIHPVFRPGSSNRTIRNGVGVLPDGRVLLAMSRQEVSFYEFAVYFRQAGCRNALYLDGLVSRTYLPEKHWRQTDGDFGGIIGVTLPKK